MGINNKIAKIPFFVLYLVLIALICFNWIRVILFQQNFEVFRSMQPWDYYLSNLFAKTFGVTQQQYFLFALPVVLVGLYLIPKIVGKLISLDKNSNVKGDNHVALILILLIAPVSLGLYKLFDFGWKSYLIPGIILISAFSIWSWIDEKKNRP
jgi:hypothetical protein